MEKLLAGISTKIVELVERKRQKHGVENLSSIQKMLSFIKLFKEYVAFRMKKPPEMKCMHAFDSRGCRAKIAEILQDISTLQDTVAKQNSTHEILLKNMTTCIKNEEELMRNIEEILVMKIPEEMKKSMSSMLTEKEKEAWEKLLQSDINTAEQRLYKLIGTNAATEKKLFDICAMVEQEYKALLIRYDRSISTLNALIDSLLRKNKSLVTNKKNMESQLVVQRARYIQLREEREVALMKAFTEQLEFFQQNRASKIIQRAWRGYFERISLKKKRKTRRK